MALDDDFFKQHVRGFYIQNNRISFSCNGDYRRVKKPVQERYNANQPEAVFKIVSYAKTAKSVSNTLHYIAQHSQGLEEPVEIIDALGSILKPEDINQAVKDLKLEQEEKSRKTVHFVLSFPKDSKLARKQIEDFIADYMQPFADDDYQYFAGIHTHQSANHAHILLKMSNGVRRLKFDVPQLDMMRKRQVEIGRKYGLDYQATRCKDRCLELGRKPKKARKRTLLERQVPEWYAKRQAEKEREKMGFKSEIRAVHYDVGKEAQHTYFPNGQRALTTPNARNNCSLKCMPKNPKPPCGMRITVRRCLGKTICKQKLN